MSETTARADLLDLLAQWFLTTGKGSREHADRILNKHAHELAEKIRKAPEDMETFEGMRQAANLIDPDAAVTGLK